MKFVKLVLDWLLFLECECECEWEWEWAIFDDDFFLKCLLTEDFLVIDGEMQFEEYDLDKDEIEDLEFNWCWKGVEVVEEEFKGTIFSLLLVGDRNENEGFGVELIFWFELEGVILFDERWCIWFIKGWSFRRQKYDAEELEVAEEEGDSDEGEDDDDAEVEFEFEFEFDLIEVLIKVVSDVCLFAFKFEW